LGLLGYASFGSAGRFRAIISFQIRVYANSHRRQIGFVFSNRQAGETPDLLFSIYYCLLSVYYPKTVTLSNAKGLGVANERFFTSLRCVQNDKSWWLVTRIGSQQFEFPARGRRLALIGFGPFEPSTATISITPSYKDDYVILVLSELALFFQIVLCQLSLSPI
jgi:hypothetical protein